MLRLGAANGAGLGRPAGDVARSQRARRAPGERTPAICRLLRAGERSLRRHRRPWHHRTRERRGGRHTASPQARTARQAVDHLHRARPARRLSTAAACPRRRSDRALPLAHYRGGGRRAHCGCAQRARGGSRRRWHLLAARHRAVNSGHSPEWLLTTVTPVRELMIKRLEGALLDVEAKREMEMALEELDVMWGELQGDRKSVV